MTDDEMAKEYAIGRTYPRFETDYIANFVLREVEGAFLAGLKAGRPKWHKVADGDLPKDRRNVYVVYLNEYGEIEKTIASFRHRFWVFDGHKTECEIIAWSEIPKISGGVNR